MSATLDAAETYVARGWRVFLLAPGAGVPFKGSHGVNDATTDLDVIRAGLGEHPDANLAIATGAPGPQVFDADDLDAAQGVIAKLPASVPWAAIPGTNHPPGRHYYLAGQQRGTVGLGFGELRGTGSYVVAPPSIRKGRQYTWVAEPNGALLEVPTFLVPERTATWGCGDQDEVEHVPPGSMYDHLGDLATRCACAGMHRAVIERVLLAEFEAVREPGAGYGDPVRGRRDTERLAEWAAGSDIAQREREHGGDLVGLVAMWGAHGLRRRRR